MPVDRGEAVRHTVVQECQAARETLRCQDLGEGILGELEVGHTGRHFAAPGGGIDRVDAREPTSYDGRASVLDPDADTGPAHLVTVHPSARNDFQCLPMSRRDSGERGSSRPAATARLQNR